jgi:oligoribonuclease
MRPGAYTSAHRKIMAQDASRLIWVDLEMSGLKPDSDRIIEVAMVITDENLGLVAEGPVRAVHQSDQVLDAMDNWNKATHGRSGLIDRVRTSSFNEAQVEDEMIGFLSAYVPAGISPMCGNSVCQDRRFLARYMPRLEAYFHYRNLDVSTLKELARRWKPELMSGLVKQGKHEALADIYESIEELRYYREHLLKV